MSLEFDRSLYYQCFDKILHDIMNILSIIQMNSGMLKMEMESGQFNELRFKQQEINLKRLLRVSQATLSMKFYRDSVKRNESFLSIFKYILKDLTISKPDFKACGEPSFSLQTDFWIFKLAWSFLILDILKVHPEALFEWKTHEVQDATNSYYVLNFKSSRSDSNQIQDQQWVARSERQQFIVWLFWSQQIRLESVELPDEAKIPLLLEFNLFIPKNPQQLHIA